MPKVDADGNEIAGIRLPDVRVPIRTYSGWSLRSGAWANDGCEGSGQSVAFPTTKAAREASGDPRLSIEERYPNFFDYYYKVIAGDRRFGRRAIHAGGRRRRRHEPHAERGIRDGRHQDGGRRVTVADAHVKRPPLGGRFLLAAAFSCAQVGLLP